jgi:hypothetical protein
MGGINMKNTKILLKMLNRFCNETSEGVGCSACINYDLCERDIWDDAQEELQKIDEDIDIRSKE